MTFPITAFTENSLRQRMKSFMLLSLAVNMRAITGTANILCNRTPVVTDAAFGNHGRLLCCFIDCILQLHLTCKNSFI